MESKTIVFVGDLNDYTRTFQRYRTLVSMGYKVFGVSSVVVPWRAGINRPGFLGRFFWKLGFPLDATSVNKKMIEKVRKHKPDVLWIEKGNTIRPATLKVAKKDSPRTKIISTSEDDMYGKHNHSAYYVKGLPYYDVVFTTKLYNINELKTIGARRTELFLDAYNEDIHRPLKLSAEDIKEFGSDVGFAGSFENDRAERMLYLAEHGTRVTIWGNDWRLWTGKHQNLIVKNRHLYGIDYTKVINATKINLCFLRRLNRDEITSRSAEIPACGAFMLGERTKRHMEFLEEGKEAEFFGDDEELLKKVRYYLVNEEKRARIARTGMERCHRSGYSMKAQLNDMLQKVIG